MTDAVPRGHGHRNNIVAIAIILATTAAIYAPTLTGDFLNWDDDRFVTNNPHVERFSMENLAWAFGGLRFESYQPLHMVSYMLDGSLFGQNPVAFRLHNLLLFWGACLLLYWFLRRCGFSALAATTGVLIFGLAPARVESVAWISCRKDVLALFLSLAVWHVHLSYGATTRKKLVRRTLALLLFTAALMSKSSAFILPWMILIHDWLLRDKNLKQAILGSLHLTLPALGVAVFLPLLWSSSTLVRDPVGEGILGLFRLSGWSFWHYFTASFFPIDLSPLYAKPTMVALSAGAARGYITLCTLLTLLVIFWKRRSISPIATPIVVAISWFIIGIAPFLNLVPTYFLLADCYLLFPSLGVALFAAAHIETLKSHRWISFAVVGFFLLGCTALSLRDGQSWRTSERLWETAVERQPTAFYARLKLGETLRGNDKYRESADQYREAQAIRPLSPVALGGVFWGEVLAEGKPLGLSDQEARQMAFYFVSIANDPEKLRDFTARLQKQGLERSANIAQDRGSSLSIK